MAFGRGYVMFVVLALFVANIMNYGHRLLIAVLLPAIRADIGLSDTEAGILMGGAFALIYALSGVPLAYLADRSVRRTFIAVALLIWSLLTGTMALAGSFLQMVALRAGIGAAEAVCIPCSHSLIADYVPARLRGTAYAFHSAGAVVGITAAMILGGHFGALIGWRQTILLLAAPGVILAAIIWLFVREPRRGVSEAGAAPPDFVGVFRHLLSQKTYLFVLLAISFAMLVEFGTNQWLPSFYVRQYGVSIDEVGLKYGLAVALGGIPGSILGGIVVDRLAARDIRWLVWMIALLYICAVPVGFAMVNAADVDTALALNTLYAFLIMGTNGPSWASVFILVPATMRTTASATTLTVAGVVGLSMGPILVGVISDAMNASLGDQALRFSLMAVISVSGTVIVAMLVASLFLRREYERYRLSPGFEA